MRAGHIYKSIQKPKNADRIIYLKKIISKRGRHLLINLC